MQKKTYRSHSPELKIKVLRRHIMDKVPVSELCEEHDIKPSVFYSWQKDLFERGAVVFNSGKKGRPQENKQQKRIHQLEAKLTQKNEVLAELMQEHINLKKEFGGI